MTDLNIAIIGASGGIGSAFVELLAEEQSNTVYAFSRTEVEGKIPWVEYGSIDYSEESSIIEAAQKASQSAPLDLVIVASGVLQDGKMMPEKALRDINTKNLERNFLVNAIGPALVAKHFLPALQTTKRAVFAALSARVGSITDNRLGGWYAYRASKAALNMLIKTASIEVARRKKNAIVVGLHPGTVATGLSHPFQARVPKNKLFSANYAAAQLTDLMERLSTDDTGKVFAWDGAEVPC